MGCGTSKSAEKMAVGAVRNQMNDGEKKEEKVEKAPSPPPAAPESPPKPAEEEQKKAESPPPEPAKEEEPAEAAKDNEHKITLHFNPLSYSSLPLQMYLEVRGIPYNKNIIDLKAGDNKTEEFLAKNPRGKIPVLQVGDHFVPESWGIIMFLEDKIEKNRLGLEDDAKNAVCLNRFVDAMELVTKTTDLARKLWWSEDRPALESEETKKIVLEYIQELKYWEDRFGDGEYIAGDTLTYADIGMFTPLLAVHACGFDGSNGDFPKLTNWFKKVSSHDVISTIAPTYKEHLANLNPPPIFEKLADLLAAKKEQEAAEAAPEEGEAEEKKDEGEDAPAEEEKKEGEDAPAEEEKKEGEDAPAEEEKKEGEDAPAEEEKKEGEDAPVTEE